jgi:DNA recombination protein RmuC
MHLLYPLLIVVAAGGGALAAWLAASVRLQGAAAQADLWRTRAEEEGRARVAAEASAARVVDLETECSDLRNKLVESAAAAAASEAKLVEQEQGHNATIAAVTSIQQKVEGFLKNVATETLLDNQQAFLTIANEILQKHQQGASTELNALVSPIRETLETYQLNITKLDAERNRSNGALSAELKNVVDAGNLVRLETSKLVTALRASPKTRGRWGENTLRNVLELAGLSSYCDFAVEQSYAQDGALSRPDVLIRLPGGRSLVVDAKASMKAYLDAVEAAEDAERERHLALHAQQLRAQVKLLAAKAYWDHLPQTPDYVIMFVPGENFYAAAAERDPELFEFAFRQRVLIVTPAILIALARIVAYNWRQESATENAKQILEIGQELYKRLVTMGGYVGTLGSSLAGSVRKYNEFVGSLENSVLPQARRFNELGVKGADSQLPVLLPVEVEPRRSRYARDMSSAALRDNEASDVAC